ncbi:unnamed protein product [Vitrella brassicaformis CCMP3155]|uniref:NTF2 domain-containing protein n=2 Tax=Vitrella brassicaformis TaxID=1169539 RepID=A0A0G4FSP8_VITBC|nr:unnamed protein product [Vitrella brassicaformis CCMP3155]|eukprot:CEM17738.1 unnamed protein product [Vitrella brassicaformis CCMP3155]
MDTPSVQFIAEEFLKAYYSTMNERPEEIYKFYKTESTMERTVENSGGDTRTARGQKEINDLIMCDGFLKSHVKTTIKTFNAQHADSRHSRYVVINLTGVMWSNDDSLEAKRFVQMVILNSSDFNQSTSWYVHNDWFCFLQSDDDVFQAKEQPANGQHPATTPNEPQPIAPLAAQQAQQQGNDYVRPQAPVPVPPTEKTMADLNKQLQQTNNGTVDVGTPMAAAQAGGGLRHVNADSRPAENNHVQRPVGRGAMVTPSGGPNPPPPKRPSVAKQGSGEEEFPVIPPDPESWAGKVTTGMGKVPPPKQVGYALPPTSSGAAADDGLEQTKEVWIERLPGGMTQEEVKKAITTQLNGKGVCTKAYPEVNGGLIIELDKHETVKALLEKGVFFQGRRFRAVMRRPTAPPPRGGGMGGRGAMGPRGGGGRGGMRGGGYQGGGGGMDNEYDANRGGRGGGGRGGRGMRGRGGFRGSDMPFRGGRGGRGRGIPPIGFGEFPPGGVDDDTWDDPEDNKRGNGGAGGGGGGNGEDW